MHALQQCQLSQTPPANLDAAVRDVIVHNLLDIQKAVEPLIIPITENMPSVVKGTTYGAIMGQANVDVSEATNSTQPH